MKKLLFAFTLIFAAAATSFAQTDTTSSAAGSSTEYSQEYTEQETIAQSELPSIIQDQLASQDYAAWTVDKAFKKEKDGKTFYGVELRSGNESKIVKFDAQGNKVKEKDKEHKMDMDKEHKMDK
jgi:hypothetical protein